MKTDGSGRKVASQANEQFEQFPKKCSNGPYKDLEAFRHSLGGSCYIPDGTRRCYTGEELLEMSLWQKEIAEEMFLSIAGQDPEAWLDEKFQIGELAICLVCGHIYQSYMRKDCPLCRK
ncbi:MAG: hypothetical protein KZY87_07835 [Lachnospiraceae bacterium]|nr:hypothetical protein [Lachnospiraceae bacterium]